MLLPESAVSRVNEATVVAVGPGSRNRDGEIVPLPIEVGAKVMLPEYGGHAVKLGDGDDNEFALFRADDLLGVFEVCATMRVCVRCACVLHGVLTLWPAVVAQE